MLPTQPNNWGRRWRYHPEVGYDFNHRFAWPAPPAAEAAAGAAGAGAAEGAAAHFAHTAAAGAGGPGGIPPRGPWGHHNYYNNHHPYRRGWGRKPFLKRVFWFGLGAWIGVHWYKQHQKQKEDKWNRFINAFASPQQVAPSPPTPASTPAPLVDHTVEPAVPVDARRWGWHDERDKSHGWGWKGCREEREKRWGWRYRQQQAQAEERGREQQQEKQAQQSILDMEKGAQTEIDHVSRPASAPVVPAPAPAPAPITGTHSDPLEGDGGEMTKLREAVERLWEEKKRDAAKAQEVANERAKEFAREKLEKLSAALETLRESLKQDAAAKPKEDKKLV